jgi:hypothetical protein
MVKWLWYEGMVVAFDHQESRSNWGACCLLNTNAGIYASVLNDATRHDSELFLNWELIYQGNQESIGQGVAFGNSVYFPAEGNGVVATGASARTAMYLRHSSAACVYRNQPCVIASLDEGEWVINLETGAKVLQLNVPAKTGIPFAVDYIPGSEELVVVLADNDNPADDKLTTTVGVTINLTKATAVVNWKGRLVAGGNGRLHDVDVAGRRTTQFLDTGSKIVTHLWYDVAEDFLWVACSGPDKLAYFDSNGTWHVAATLPDGEPNGGMFGSRVTKGWWSRNKAPNQAQWLRVAR